MTPPQCPNIESCFFKNLICIGIDDVRTIGRSSRFSIITFCYVFEGSSYFANQKLEAFMNYVKKTPDLLKKLEESVKAGFVFSGQTFEQIDSYIKDFFF